MDFRLDIASLISKYVQDLTVEDIYALVEIPPDDNMGDYAFPCFRLAKVFRKSPVEIAKDLFEKIEKENFLSKIEHQGGYLNFFVDNYTIIKKVYDKVTKEKENYCRKNPIIKP